MQNSTNAVVRRKVGEFDVAADCGYSEYPSGVPFQLEMVRYGGGDVRIMECIRSALPLLVCVRSQALPQTVQRRHGESAVVEVDDPSILVQQHDTGGVGTFVTGELLHLRPISVDGNDPTP